MPRKTPAMRQKARAYTQASRFTQSFFCCFYLLQPIQTESALLPYIQLQPSALPLAWALPLAAIRGQEQDDAAYERRKFRHKAHYSLNREDGIENDALNRPLTPAEVLEQKLLREEVYAALMQLTDIQARRIYARFYLGMTVAEIARIEGADRRRVWESIRRGLKKLARLLDTAK